MTIKNVTRCKTNSDMTITRRDERERELSFIPQANSPSAEDDIGVLPTAAIVLNKIPGPGKNFCYGIR